jgi:hypothetical protein
MHNYIVVILMLAAPAFGQLHRGNAGSRFSGLHNHWAIPIDGGQVYAWDMNNPGQTDCISHHVPNNATFTGSPTTDLQCGGGGTPQISSTGFVPGGGFLAGNAPSLPNGWTISVVFNSSNLSGAMFVNFNYPSANTEQYVAYAGAHVFLGYSPGGTFFSNTFETSTNFNTANTWQANTLAYKSATADSAALWFNKNPVAGSWTGGAGTSALPAVQAETDIGGLHGNDNTFVGTVGYVVVHDHRINSSAQGFIYNALYRAMQFRGVALPQ